MGVPAKEDEVASLIRQINPGSEALQYLEKQNLAPDEMIRVLKLMRVGTLDESLDQGATKQ
jgi:hypothetical protein